MKVALLTNIVVQRIYLIECFTVKSGASGAALYFFHPRCILCVNKAIAYRRFF